MALDRAVLLPGQELMEKMDREYNRSGENVEGEGKEEQEEERIRDEERGSQVESERGGKGQDPEQPTPD